MKICDELETLREFTFLGDRVSAGGGYETAVTAGVKFRECCELLYGRRFALRLKGAVYKYYVMPAILYGSETWSLRESEMGILRRTGRSMVRAMCGVQLNHRKRSYYLMLTFVLNENLDHLAMAHSAGWYVYLLRREDGYILILRLKVKGRKDDLRGNGRSRLKKKV